MSDPLYAIIDSKLEPTPFVALDPDALQASVEAYLESLKQPRVYFERVDATTWRAVYGNKVFEKPLATWAIAAIETAAMQS